MEGANITYLVGFNHGKCRTFHRAGMTQAPDQPAGQGGFAGPQVALEKNHTMTFGHFGHHTPRHAACQASSPWASKAASTPVNTSPNPAPAMAGCPRPQKASCPAGSATNVPAPLSTQTLA
ncbi:hypothetical protein WR25_23805 [Diploscapter pachys]|uniref:Uncharacterized protein n=1 Tax=Diploscapter pachys TaxID=2018661 RepID=A0A2A2K5L1_9BILA|nr:hypothetical protein WR25_23805 [Diploscapter pachys]